MVCAVDGLIGSTTGILNAKTQSAEALHGFYEQGTKRAKGNKNLGQDVIPELTPRRRARRFKQQAAEFYRSRLLCGDKSVRGHDRFQFFEIGWATSVHDRG